MDRYYFKPLGLEYCQVWLQNRIQHLPPFKIYFSIPLYLFFYPFSYLAGSFIPHPFGSGGSSSSRPRKDGLLFSTVPGQKTQWIESADHKFEIPKQLHHLQAISYGIGKIRYSAYIYRPLYVHNRPSGRLLPRSNSLLFSKIPQIFSLFSRGLYPPLSVSGSPLWYFLSSESFYKNHGGGCCLPEATEGVYCSIFRRPSDYRKRQIRSYYRKRFYHEETLRSGVVNQHPKVRSVSLHAQKVSRSNVKLYSYDVLSPPGKSRRSKTSNPLLQKKNLHYSPRSYEDPGSSYGLPSICHLEPEPLSYSTELDPPFLEPENLGIGQKDHHSILGKKRSAMVVGGKASGKRGSLALPSVSYHHDRCKQPGLGSSLPLALRPGILDPFTSKETIKLSGTTSRLGSLKDQSSSSEESARPHTDRQHHGGILPEATRRYKVGSSLLPDSHHLFLGRREHTLSFCNSSKRSPEHGGRLPQQESGLSQRMVFKSGNFLPVDRSLGHSANRPFRHKRELIVSSILLSGGKGAEGSTRCFQSPMGRTSLLRLSPYSLGRKGPQEDPYGPGKGNTHLPELAKKGLVPSADIPGHPATSDTASKEGSSAPGSYSASRPGEASVSGLDPESDFLRSQGLSRAVVSTLKASRKKVTFAIYHKIWKRFVTFCGDNPPSQPNPNIFQILDFLQKGLELGLSTSTLKVQVSALGAFFDFPLADHRWVKRFIVASSRIRPQVLRKTPTWDLTLVLDALSRPPFEPLDSTNIKNLTLKTTLLIAVTTAKRLGELQAISIREPYMRILSDRIILTLDPGFVPKVVSKFHRDQEITLPSFCEDPSSNEEASWHLLDGKNKGKKASKTSIARWLKLAISTCYTLQGKEVPTNLRAHSTRAMSASWAERRGASLEQICKAATWASPSTFIKHYRLDLPGSQDLSFGRKVLQAVIPP
ncbi:uncharacterized protein [Engystomops pustulosus]|uniref:uncharacterized protein isoform X1 n=1 Tax=Engystomops pustulosus TaxID=76066 RepID=UPI003AFAA0C0